jgi:hypothetical protein
MPERQVLREGAARFRTSLTTTQALVDGKNLLSTSRILSHSPAAALKHYTRADGLEASRRHANYIDPAVGHRNAHAQASTSEPSQAEAGALHDLTHRGK